MANETMTAITEFGTTVTNSIQPVQVLGIMGAALTAGVAIYLVAWAGKKIVRTFVNALNGHIGV